MNEIVMWEVYCTSCDMRNLHDSELCYWDGVSFGDTDNAPFRCPNCGHRLLAALGDEITKRTVKPEPPPAVKVRRAPLPGVKVTHMVCGGCGELFQPKEPKQVVCDAACRSVQEQEQKKARDHAYRVRAGVLE